jgi:outer membrane protein assembly factor BamD (BamD/ComL family)
MIRRKLVLGLLPLPALLLCQCSDKQPGPVLIGQSKQKVAEGDALFRKAEAEQAAGDMDDAIELYQDVADDFPFSTHAGEARYRQAKLLDEQGESRDAFKAYDAYLKNYPSHPQYGKALDRVFDIAIGAKRGDVQTNFLGLKGHLPLSETLEMLSALKRYAPQSDKAAQAQYAIGELYLREEKYSESVAAFRKVAEQHRSHKLAPEALFRVGKILLEEARRGNQNQATIDLSREAFNDYLIQFPGHKRNAQAREMIAVLTTRELERSLDIADYYLKTGQIESAKIYYRDVAKRAKPGKLRERAQARLKEIGN